MRAIAIDRVAWSVGLSVCLYVSVCPLVMFLSPVKTTEPIEMPFGGLTRVVPSQVTM